MNALKEHGMSIFRMEIVNLLHGFFKGFYISLICPITNRLVTYGIIIFM